MTTIEDALAAVDRLPAVEPCTIGVTCEVIEERKRQTVRWGEQHHPDGTGTDRAQVYADALRRVADANTTVTWAQVLLAEVAAAMAEQPGSPDLRAHLLRIGAVAVAWVEDIDHRGHAEAAPLTAALTTRAGESGLQWRRGRGLLG